MTNLDFPRACIFDWDNTLVESWAHTAAALNHTLAEFGHTPWTLEEVKKRSAYAAREYFPSVFGDVWEKANETYLKRWRELRQNEKIEALAGAEDLLRWLQDRKIPAFVVSNKRGPFLRQEIEWMKWEGFFAGVVGAQDVARDKPARDPVDHALKQAGLIASEEVWFVGDLEVDMLCAQTSGCTPVFIGDAQVAARLSVARAFSDCKALQRLLYSLA